jgi:hypothetical protein
MKPLRTTKGPADWQALLADPAKQWRAGFSAMATAQCWDAGFPPEVAQVLGAGAELQLAIVEHQVPLPGGGYPSQCDVFALVHAQGRDLAVAIEAKVNEPFGPVLSEWLGDAPANKKKRLDGLCNLLGLPDNIDPNVHYQLLHRTAAAVIEARRFRRGVAAMVVHSFSPQNRWFEEFSRFCALFGLNPRIGEGAEVTLPDGMTLRLGWAKGDEKFLKELGTT